MMTDLGEGPFTIMFDTKEMKPGCAIIQALGGSPGIANEFDTSVWITAPTPNMRLYEITKKQLETLIERVHARHRKNKA